MKNKKAQIANIVLWIGMILIGIALAPYIFGNLSFTLKSFQSQDIITYSFDQNNSCPENEKGYIRKAFQIIQNDTNGIIKFNESHNHNGDIIFECYDEYNPDALGYAEYYSDDNEIEGIIILYNFYKIYRRADDNIYYAEDDIDKNNPMKKDECPKSWNCYLGEENKFPVYPSTEIHEILHLFEYEHNNNTSSIMYFQKNYYNNDKIDDWIIQDLKERYS